MHFRNLVRGKLTFSFQRLTMLFNFSSRFITVLMNFLAVAPFNCFQLALALQKAIVLIFKFSRFARARLFASLDGLYVLSDCHCYFDTHFVLNLHAFLRSIYQFTHTKMATEKSLAHFVCPSTINGENNTQPHVNNPDMKCDGIQTKTTEPNKKYA